MIKKTGRLPGMGGGFFFTKKGFTGISCEYKRSATLINRKAWEVWRMRRGWMLLLLALGALAALLSGCGSGS